ncbi:MULTISPECIES: FKBP-type peptidyl-prolyl cis-trans isomerase N-terminal domain-containing protein [Sphaerochaeta]|jgi:FKBP-type peptidyl-prolyl cis-trans isomerase FkpA|uniref:peptidylprolyl isomerase n=2 Tax=root TaxID=1 RepID=A0ABY4D9V3_9SPIR|nr:MULTISPECIES: FKBP-type peptidyl-prolyl cis-trans isomerase N-terminal domain-containing protein [Sphaerochaeta]MDT3360254.1 FKBP-type peptidyl-prolyl cis-trans isomerase [Spirochaetota bacterium]NLA97445.1 FKBP-type peptidyl-prolyl cis-trans isomerase [Spirochaetales bacterium]MDD2394327.1 FKBP-type peptidyl-prolyl cis-trans isomerase N-terminal domain-containing protein [Sphaerochaeta sp.]MDD3423654.1 FKBP-type peptidyl-prolyl cis-trans isomerase N-terminal domain-containing protein [Sphae
MNKSNRTKVVVTLLAMILISSSLFAMGMKESDPAAVTVRILTTMNQNGQVTLVARSADNQDLTFQAGSYTDASYPIASLGAGDYVEVVLDNNKAMNIRYINPLVTLGVLPYSISMERATELESLTDRFSYTYGYLLIQSFSSQGLFFDAGYYVKGALDGYKDSLSEVPNGYYSLEELYANVNDYQEKVWNAGLANTDYGKSYTSISEVTGLAKPEDLSDAFSYTYGYLLALNMAGQGITVNGDLYAQGALDYACDNQLLMNDAEMQVAFTEYQQILEKEYQEWIAEIAVSNLAEAEAFLAQNSSNEGVVVTPSGLQYQVLTPATGNKPVLADTVEVNYQLQLIDGTVVESSYDMGQTAHFPVNGLIEGFTEALLAMNTGSVVRTWIHPSLGYGEMGTETILPNALLIFDIELVGIDQ